MHRPICTSSKGFQFWAKSDALVHIMFWAKMSSRLSCCCVLGASFWWVHCHCPMAICGPNGSCTGGLELGHLRFGTTNYSMWVFIGEGKSRLDFHTVLIGSTYPLLSSFILRHSKLMLWRRKYSKLLCKTQSRHHLIFNQNLILVQSKVEDQSLMNTWVILLFWWRTGSPKDHLLPQIQLRFGWNWAHILDTKQTCKCRLNIWLVILIQTKIS